jgi:prephenate dehydrogenase
MFGRVAVLGCGHIGGSLALALRRYGVARRVIGYDAAGASATLVDEVAASAAEAVEGTDLVVLAVPVRAIPELAREIAAHTAPGTIVTDVGSTKAEIVAACEAVLGARFVGGHPMAGTERSGPASADAQLFEGRTVVLTPTRRTVAVAADEVATMWRAVGARVTSLGPAAHDAAIAAVSHLPHVAAFALAGTLADEASRLAGLAGGSFDSGTRVAASAPAAWVEILLANRAALAPWIEHFAARVEALRAAVVAEDADALAALLAEGGATRRTILGPR